jgi:hypothetical protein
MTDVTSQIELYDSDIAAIDRGPLKWATEQQGKAMVLDSFVRGVVGRFEDIGLRSRVNTHESSEPGTYVFEIVITGRIEEKAFDYDKMVHEVVHNLLDIPGEGGVIKADMDALGPLKHNHKH